MIKFIFALIPFFCYQIGKGQQLHVRYSFVRSEVAVLNEDLYIEGNKVISVQDSIFDRPSRQNSDWFSDVEVKGPGNGKVNKNYYISDLNYDGDIKKFFFTSSPYSLKDQTNYFIYDEVKKPQWKIDEKSTKKILGYTCIKATTTFRGAEMTAYYTKELPYSAGPFKFFGLPGLILDIRENGMPNNIWRATLIELNDKTKINYKPEFKLYPKITMKDFVRKNDELSNSFNSELLKKLPPGTKMESDTKRVQLEKKFEWEK